MSSCNRFQHQADDWIIYSYVFVLKQQSATLIPKTLPFITVGVCFIFNVWVFLMPRFPIFGKRKQMTTTTTTKLLDWSIRTLIYSVILMSSSFYKLLIIWNCADKGEESFHLLSRWNKLHQTLDRTYKCWSYSSLYRTGIIKNRFCILVGSTNIETYRRYRLYFKQVSIRISVSATDFFIGFRVNRTQISQLLLNLLQLSFP